MCSKIWLRLCELVPLDSHPRAWSFLQTDSHWTARSGEEQAFHPVSGCHSGTNPWADHQVVFLSSGEPLHSVPKSRARLAWYMSTWSGCEIQKNLSSCVGSWPAHMLSKFLKNLQGLWWFFLGGGVCFGFGNYKIPACFFVGWGFYFKYKQSYSNVLPFIVVRESNMSVWRVPLQTLDTMMSTTAPRWPVLGQATPPPPLAVPVAWPTPVRRATCVTAMLKVELNSGRCTSGNPLFTFI